LADWYMMTLVGRDRPGIVAKVTKALYTFGCNLGEASMIRLGGTFTVMMMVSAERSPDELSAALGPVAQEVGLHVHIDAVDAGLHQHLVPNVQVRVTGADRAGIVADVTGALAATGFNILELESDVAGQADRPVYIMHIEGYSQRTLEELETAVSGLVAGGISVDIAAVETLIG